MRSLRIKLIFAFLVVGVAGIALVALFSAFATAGEFGDFVLTQREEAMAEQLASFYQQNQGWGGLPDRFQGRDLAAPREWPGMGPFLLVDASGMVVNPGRGYGRGDYVPLDIAQRGAPITVDDQVVGWLVVEAGSVTFEPPESAFLKRVNNALLLGGLGGLAVAIVLGIILARSLSNPLREITAATKAVAAGNLDARVSVRSRDELGDLAAAFNLMNENLTRSRDQRRQMTADIAHELRTPISIILGHADGIGEGVLPADEATLGVIREEAGRLERLVEELRTLSLADAGELTLTKQRVQPARLLDQALAAHKPLAAQMGIRLTVGTRGELPELHVDTDRMLQVLGNLLSNALQHTPAGGEIQLGAQAENGKAEIWVRDSGPGIPTQELPHVFNRFYRGDKSRKREGTGSGLGLAIAKSLVQAHGGSIRVESEAGQGATFILTLPI